MGFGRMGARGGFGGMGGIGVHRLSPYLGMVATRGNIATTNNTGLHWGNSRSFHVATDNISALGIVLANWRNSSEIVAGLGSATYTASVEYPANTLTQITWSAATSVVLTSGQQLLSDVITLAVPIPKGATFWIRNFQVQPTGLLFNAFACWPAKGDALEYSATIVGDKTMNTGTTYTNGSGGGPQYPAAIVGMTTLPSVLSLGDSRVQGTGTDAVDAAGALGEHARSLEAAAMGYCNAGASGDAAWRWAGFSNGGVPLDSIVNRVGLATYASHVMFNYGINDVGNGSAFTLAQIQGFMQTLWGKFPAGKKFIQTTIPPNTLSSDAWATLVNQSAQTNFPLNGTGVRDQLNAWFLTKPSPLSQVFDVSSKLVSAGNADLWNCPVAGGGTAAAVLTGDGLHETPAGYTLIQTSGVINSALITR